MFPGPAALYHDRYQYVPAGELILGNIQNVEHLGYEVELRFLGNEDCCAIENERTTDKVELQRVDVDDESAKGCCWFQLEHSLPLVRANVQLHHLEDDLFHPDANICFLSWQIVIGARAGICARLSS